MQNLVGGPKGVSSGRWNEVNTFCAFLFFVPWALLQLTLKGVAQRPMHQNTCFRGGYIPFRSLLVFRFYRPPFLPQKPFFGVRPAICFNMGSVRKHPLMFKIDIGKLHCEQEYEYGKTKKCGQILPPSHWSRGTAWHSAKITEKHGQNAINYL